MSNQDHRMGYAPAASEVFRDDLPWWFTFAHPLGVPKRIADEIQVLEGKLAAKHLPPPFDPTAQLYMTASDTPGVLLAADPVEIQRSLDRIERALGAEKAYAARDALRARAVREAYPWHVAAIDAWTYDRTTKAEQVKQPSAEALKAIQLCEAQRMQPRGSAVAADINRQQGEYGLLQRMATVQSKLENLRLQQHSQDRADVLQFFHGCNIDK